MHKWLMRNVSLLAFLLILGILVFAGLSLVPVLIRIPSYIGRADSSWQLFVGGSAAILLAAMYLLGIAIAYGLLLRFLALCDDIAAIRAEAEAIGYDNPGVPFPALEEMPA